MLRNKSINRLYGVLSALLLLTLGACSDKNDPDESIPDPDPMELLRGSWTMTTAGYGLSTAPTGTNILVLGTTNNVTMTCAESASSNTIYTNASGTYSVTDSNILKVEWSAMTVDGESDSAFTTFYLMGAASVEGSTMQWDYSIYDKSTSTLLAGPFTARFTRNN